MKSKLSMASVYLNLESYYKLCGSSGLHDLFLKGGDFVHNMLPNNKEKAEALELINEDGMHSDIYDMVRTYITQNEEGEYILCEPGIVGQHARLRKEVGIEEIFIKLQNLMSSANLVSVIELVKKCRNPSYKMFGESENIVREFRLIGSDGSVDELVRKVVLSSIKGNNPLLYKLVKPALYDDILNFPLPSVSHKKTLKEPEQLSSDYSIKKVSSTLQAQSSSARSIPMEEYYVGKNEDRREDVSGLLETKIGKFVRNLIKKSSLSPKPNFQRVLFDGRTMVIEVFIAKSHEIKQINKLISVELESHGINVEIIKPYSFAEPRIKVLCPLEKLIDVINSKEEAKLESDKKQAKKLTNFPAFFHDKGPSLDSSNEGSCLKISEVAVAYSYFSKV